MALLASLPYADAAIYDIYSSGADGVTTAADQVAVGSTYYRSTSATSVTALYGNEDITWSSQGLHNTSGSGGYTAMYRIQASGTERGYNASGAPRYDQVGGVGIPILPLSNATVVTYSGTTYFEFLFDGNEGGGNDSAISLDEFMIFTSPNLITTATASSTPTSAELVAFFESQGGTLRYSLDSLDSADNVTVDNTVLFYAGGGSGHADEGLYVPTSVMEGGALAAALTDYVYVWSKMGGLGTYNPGSGNVNFGASGGFEEFAYFQGHQGGLPYGSTVPETDASIGGLLLVTFAILRRRRTLVPLRRA